MKKKEKTTKINQTDINSIKKIDNNKKEKINYNTPFKPEMSFDGAVSMAGRIGVSKRSRGEIDKNNWYCIKFDTPKNITALEFSKKMNAFLEEIEAFNHSIVNGIDETYTVASYVEDFETGSVKWWLLDKLQKTDDKAIEKFVDSPVKTTIAGILKFAKTKAIEALQNDLTKEERKIKIINPIVEEIERKRLELERHGLSSPIKLNEDKMFSSLSNMSNISKSLDGKVSFIEKFEENKENEKVIAIPQNFEYKAENNTDNNKETIDYPAIIVNEPFICLTPTSKENCLWEFEDGDNKIQCKMDDAQFFKEYVSGLKKLGGREKMQLQMKIEKFELNRKIKKRYTIIKVEKLLGCEDLFSE
jgi:hypothetical protein